MLRGESECVSVIRMGHWACGWFELIIVQPDCNAAVVAYVIEGMLEGYPILDETDFGEREQEAANLTWKQCYNDSERVEYVRSHRSQFDFHNLQDMMACVRGRYFAGYASELLG
jgi:hypothetical protein